eukprot:375471_1
MEPQIQMMQPQQQQQQPTQPQQHEPEDETHHELDDFGGTMRRIPSAATTPLDESDLINFCDMEDIDIPDYTDDDEEEKGIDPMQLIAAKNKLNQTKNKSQFPDTQAIKQNKSKRKRKIRKRHNNTSQSPLPQMGQIGDMTPSSVVIKQSDSDDTYDDESDSDDPPEPHASRGSQRVFDANDNKKLLMNDGHNKVLRAGTMTNIAKLMNQSKSQQKPSQPQHRHSRSELPKSFIKKNELFNIYQSQNNIHSTKQYFANVTKIAKTNQSVVEKKALKEMEKKYKPQLMKTQQELEEARRKSLKHEQEMKNMKRELEALRRAKHTQNDILSKQKQMENAAKKTDFVTNKKLRQKNLEIQELQSKLKFEKRRHKIGMSPIIYTTPVTYDNIPNTALLATASAGAQEMTKSKSSAALFRGLNRLKARNVDKKYISMKDLKKRKSLPDDFKKDVPHKRRPLWTHRSRMKKAKTVESEQNQLKMKRLGIKNRLIKKRESLLLPPNLKQMTMRTRPHTKQFTIDRNLMKRNSWHDGDQQQHKEAVDYDKLKGILVAAQRKNASSYADIEAKYEHLLAENEQLRKDNFSQKEELKTYRAPQPQQQQQQQQGTADDVAAAPVAPPVVVIKRKARKISNEGAEASFWTPIDDDVIKDTRWRYIADDSIVIPSWFCVENKKKKKKKKKVSRASYVESMLSSMKVSPAQIRGALLRVDVSVLSRDILYNLMSIAPTLSEQKFIQNKVLSGGRLSGVCEELFYALSDIGHLELRLELMTFKCTFSATMNDIFCDLFVLNGAFKAIQRSSNLERILSLLLSFGNALKSSSCGGFELASLDAIARQDSLLRGLCKYTCECAADNKYHNCMTQCIAELDCELSALDGTQKSYDSYQQILLITEELSKFGRSLRKFRKQAIATTHAAEQSTPYKHECDENDLFESMMREFLRRAHLCCKSLLDLHQEIVAIADIICTQYHFSGEPSDLLQLFATLVKKLKWAQNEYLQSKEAQRKQLASSARINRNRNKLKLLLSKKKRKPQQKMNVEQKEKEREETNTKLSKLIYQHAILMDIKKGDELLSVQRIKYLKGLAKSNELPNQLSNNPEAIQKERIRRRRRSLTNADIQIGQKMQMTLAEDEEMK